MLPEKMQAWGSRLPPTLGPLFMPCEPAEGIQGSTSLPSAGLPGRSVGSSALCRVTKAWPQITNHVGSDILWAGPETA